MNPHPGAFLPLSTASLHILLVLADENLHGYGIMQEVERQSDGQYKLGPGTLYDNLQRLLDSGLVGEAPRLKDDDRRRRRYKLTSLGRRVALAEISRLETLLRKAKGHLQPARGKKA